jgi:Rieske Fe-S protein
MDRRSYLGVAIKGLIVVGLVAGSYPFLKSMNPSAKAENDSLVVVELPELKPGIVHSIDVGGRELFVLKPSESQMEAIKQLDPYVSDDSYFTYRKDVGAFVYWAYSTKWGCPLKHQPPQDSGLREWSREAKWQGGYWDSWCEVSYDYAGRAINKYEYTFNGYTWPGEGLRTPAVFRKAGTKYVVSIYQRQ